MPIFSDRFDPESIHPSYCRGVQKIDVPPPGCKEYKLYDANGGYMGRIVLAERYATPETEQMILAIHEMNDPVEAEPPAAAHLKLA